MKLKNSLLLSLLVLFLNSLQAQNANRSFGFTAGGSFASYKISGDDRSLAANFKPGFSVGLIASFQLSPDFGFQPELNFIQEGGVLNNPYDATTNTATYYYLQLPLNFVYNINSSKGTFFVGAGPSLGLGLSGSYKITGMYQESGDIHFGGGSGNDLQSFEFGANFLAGYRFKKGFILSVNYDFGLNNIAPVSEATYHNRCFGLKLGYMFKN